MSNYNAQGFQTVVENKPQPISSHGPSSHVSVQGGRAPSFVYGWGCNVRGELGIGSFTPMKSIPTAITKLAGNEKISFATAASCGAGFTASVLRIIVCAHTARMLCHGDRHTRMLSFFHDAHNVFYRWYVSKMDGWRQQA
jgi:hypothetical protein